MARPAGLTLQGIHLWCWHEDVIAEKKLAPHQDYGTVIVHCVSWKYCKQ